MDNCASSTNQSEIIATNLTPVPTTSSIVNSNIESAEKDDKLFEAWKRHLKYLNYSYRDVPENERPNPLATSWCEKYEYIPEEYQ